MGCCIVVGRTYQGVVLVDTFNGLACKFGEWGIGRPPQYIGKGHMGERKTLEKVRARFYWPGQSKEVEQWCRNCNVCLSRKSPSHKARAPMEISQTLRPMQRVAMDILGPLPETLRGNKYILVVGEYFTKWKEAFPLKDTEALKVLVNRFLGFQIPCTQTKGETLKPRF